MSIGFSIAPRAPAIDPALLAAFQGVATPIASDNMSRMFSGGTGLRPYHDGTPLLGVALTVRTRPGDNLMVHKAIDLAEPGDVIVVDAGGDLTNSIIGEIMTTLAAKKGIAGFIIDGAVRDTDAIAASSLPVYARGVTHRGPYKDGPGEINVVACIGGSPVYPGDVIIGDADGVLAIPRAAAPEIAKLCHAQIAREKTILASIADGTVDRRWVDEMLKAKGLKL
jgi:regulator of RNase E activity RraA